MPPELRMWKGEERDYLWFIHICPQIIADNFLFALLSSVVCAWLRGRWMHFIARPLHYRGIGSSYVMRKAVGMVTKGTKIVI